MEIIIAIILGVVVICIEMVAMYYVNKIDSKPEEDFKDWDVTVADGLDELEKQEKDE